MLTDPIAWIIVILGSIVPVSFIYIVLKMIICGYRDRGDA